LDFRVRISSWIFELGFRVGFSSENFELDFRVRISSWIFELGFRDGFSSKEAGFFLLVIQLQRIGVFVRKPSRRFPVQYSQQKNSCRGGVSVLPFYCA